MHMAQPTRGNLAALKRMGLYLRGRPRLVQAMRYRGDLVAPRSYRGDRAPRRRVDWLYVPVGSDWGDCKVARKSTSGGAFQHGDHVLTTSSVTRAVQAGSSAEAELYAIFKATVQASGLQAMDSDTIPGHLKSRRTRLQQGNHVPAIALVSLSTWSLSCSGSRTPCVRAAWLS